jgi:hypothetical protein
MAKVTAAKVTRRRWLRRLAVGVAGLLALVLIGYTTRLSETRAAKAMMTVVTTVT